MSESSRLRTSQGDIEIAQPAVVRVIGDALLCLLRQDAWQGHKTELKRIPGSFIRLLSRELLERGCRTLGRTHRMTLCQKHLGKQSGEPGELNFCFTSQLQNAGKNIQLRQLCV